MVLKLVVHSVYKRINLLVCVVYPFTIEFILNDNKIVTLIGFVVPLVLVLQQSM